MRTKNCLECGKPLIGQNDENEAQKRAGLCDDCADETFECQRCGETTTNTKLVGDESYSLCDICRDDVGA